MTEREDANQVFVFLGQEKSERLWYLAVRFRTLFNSYPFGLSTTLF